MTDKLDLRRWGIDERFLEERFVRASGPGGQNVNKVATAVELRFDLPGSPLPPDMKSRLVALAGRRIAADGSLVIDSRAHRTQKQNREEARARLADLLERAARRPKNRRSTRPTQASREARISTKKRRSAVKATRGRTGSDD